MTSLRQDAYLLWLRNHPHYTWDGSTGTQLADTFQETFKMLRDSDIKENIATSMLKFHMERYNEIQRILSCKTEDNKTYFVTIGFNHQTWDIPHCCELIQRVVDASWVAKGQGKFELYRANGEHPHAHFILELENAMPKSKVVEKIYKLKGMKKFVLKKNFIDIKATNEQHKLYITGIKQEAKMPYVKKDEEWRNRNNVPDMFNSKKLLG